MHINTDTEVKVIKIAGISGILVPIIFITFVDLSISSSPWFTWIHHALSDLGIEGPSAVLFNTGIILTGILLFLFSLGLIQTLTTKEGGYILLFGSLVFSGIGIFPIPIGILHIYVSVLSFILIITSLFVLGATMKHNPFERKMGILAIMVSVGPICSFPLLLVHDGLAIIESVVLLPAFLWCMLYSATMLIYNKKELYLNEVKMRRINQIRKKLILSFNRMN